MLLQVKSNCWITTDSSLSRGYIQMTIAFADTEYAAAGNCTTLEEYQSSWNISTRANISWDWSFATRASSLYLVLAWRIATSRTDGEFWSRRYTFEISKFLYQDDDDGANSFSKRHDSIQIRGRVPFHLIAKHWIQDSPIWLVNIQQDKSMQGL